MYIIPQKIRKRIKELVFLCINFITICVTIGDPNLYINEKQFNIFMLCNAYSKRKCEKITI